MVELYKKERKTIMAIICSLCGNSQSGWVQAHPLSVNHPELKVCIQCENNRMILRKKASKPDECLKIIDYFENLQQKGGLSDEAKEVLSVIISKKDVYETAEAQSIAQNALRAEELHRIHPRAQNTVLESIEEIDRMKEQLQAFSMSSGFNFEGFNIKKYINVLSAECVLGTGFVSEFSAGMADLFGVESQKFGEKLHEARSVAQSRLIQLAISQGANALIGVSFDYAQFSSNIVGVIVNGTAVVIEPVDTKDEHNTST